MIMYVDTTSMYIIALFSSEASLHRYLNVIVSRDRECLTYLRTTASASARRVALE
jgi:hypothetical protein